MLPGVFVYNALGVPLISYVKVTNLQHYYSINTMTNIDIEIPRPFHYYYCKFYLYPVDSACHVFGCWIIVHIVILPSFVILIIIYMNLYLSIIRFRSFQSVY